MDDPFHFFTYGEWGDPRDDLNWIPYAQDEPTVGHFVCGHLENTSQLLEHPVLAFTFHARKLVLVVCKNSIHTRVQRKLKIIL